jgi:hypothetical protein
VEERGPSSKLELTSAQRNAIYQEVHKGTGKVTPDRFATDIGAVVPPMIDLYTLPDDLLANNPATQLYKFTEVDDHAHAQSEREKMRAKRRMLRGRS